MDLSVIIVNYNVKYFLDQTIRSVHNSKFLGELEIIVVDNDSKDGSVEFIREAYSDVIVIANKENVGFSKANNQGAFIAKGKYLLILNPDTVLKEDTLQKCFELSSTSNEIGAIGVRMIDGAGNFLPESKRGFPFPIVAFFKSFGLYKLFPKSKLANAYYQGHISEFQTAEVDVLSGAFMWIPKDVYEKVAGFDEDYFMYGEDIDLSYKIQKAGYKNYYNADATIIHYKGESTKKGSLNYVKVFYNAMIIFAEKHIKPNSKWPFSSLLIAFLKLAIVLRGTATFLGHAIKKLALPVIEIGLSVLLILGFKSLWARYYHHDPSYYDTSTLIINIAIYAAIFSLSMFMHGAYDKIFPWRKIRKSVVSSAFIFALLYALAPADFRISRMMILVFFISSTLITIAVRVLLKMKREGKVGVFNQDEERVALAGSREEYFRMRSLLNSSRRSSLNLIGRIGKEFGSSEEYLGSIKDLEDIISAKKLDSLIFCSKDFESGEIMEWMTHYGNQVEIKVFPENRDSVIGSASKNLRGDLFTVELEYALQTKENRRAKRLLDLVFSVIFTLFFPVLFFLSNGRLALTNLPDIILAKKTWIGYQIPIEVELPKIRKGVWTIKLRDHIEDTTTKKLSNFLYARDYSWQKDVEEIIRKLTNG